MEYELGHLFPFDIYRKAGKLGFIGMDVPEEFGGAGLGVLENVLVIEEFCKRDSGIGMALHLAQLPAKIIKICGTEEQKSRYLTPLTRGEYISAVSFTEPDHGSDLTSMDARALEVTDGYLLNGTKLFTTNGAYADFFVVLAQHDEPGQPGSGTSTFIVPRDEAALAAGNMEINELPHKMGLRMTSSAEIVFRDLKIPRENLLGPKGRGLQNILDFFNESRIEIAAQALGCAQGSFLKALKYARERKQFNTPLVDFQAIGHKLARMLGNLNACRLSVYHAAWACRYHGKRLNALIPLLTSTVKYYVPEHAKEVLDQAINVLGGYGYFLEQELERRYRDSRITEIYEGTVEVQLNNVTRLLKKFNPEYIDEMLF
ncbi:MAG: acyl-CoA dehydrogenase family protein [Deltaproteobacteria bacterium]|nr:acyl-CoA dehydrogenase family protein [Deltaproteobacteria bacterium]